MFPHSLKRLLILSGIVNTFVQTAGGTEESECRVGGEDDVSFDLYDDVAVAQLEPWNETGIQQDLFQKATAAGRKRRASIYQIIDGHLYRSPEKCMFPARCDGVEHFLKDVAAQLPDMEFVVNFNDHPLTSSKDPLPIFSFSTIPGKHSDIMYPNWAFWAGGPWLKVIPTWQWDLNRRELLDAGDAIPWPEKKDVVFFRGSRTNSDRDSILLHAQKHPDRWDAEFILNQSQQTTKYVTQTMGITPAEPVPAVEHCKYRYLMNFDGVAASFRLRDVLACGSTVLYANPTWTEFFYAKLHPWVHYVPLDLDANKAQEVLDFLWAHPELPRRIAANGRDFIEKHLTLEHVERYWLVLLKEYSSLLRFTPQKDTTFIEIK